MTKPKLARWLTLDEVAEMLGMEGGDGPRRKRLVRQLLAAESRSAPFMRRTGKGRGTRYAVTLPDLRHHCPELFDRRQEMVEQLREQYEQINARFAELADRDVKLAEAIAHLRARVTRLERMPQDAAGCRRAGISEDDGAHADDGR